MNVGSRLLGDAPLPAEIGPRGVAVDHHDRRPEQQRRDERVPHHPRGRREPQDAAARLQVPAQGVGFRCSTRMPAVSVDDRLRDAGRAGREQHVERVVERHRVELERPVLGDQRVPVGRAGDVDDVLERRQRGGDRRRPRRARSIALVAEVVAVDREQHLGLELRQPVDHAARPELGRAARPDRAERRARPRTRSASPGRSAGRRRRGRRGRRRAASAPRGRARPARAARPSSARAARAPGSRRRPRAGPVRCAAGARRS